MANSSLSEDIIKSRHVLFVGAGASEPLGLKPTRPFLELLSERLCPLILEGSRLQIEEKRSTTFLNSFFTQAAKHFGVTLPDSEVALDYLDYLAETCRELHSLPSIFRELAQTGGNSGFYDRWAKMFLQVRSYIQKIIVEHYSRVDGKHVSRIYKPLLQVLCMHGQTLSVYTTNYDWAFEYLAEESAVDLNLEDGFMHSPLAEHWSRQAFDEFHPHPQKTNLVLFKLHGSTSWYRDADPPHSIRKFPNPAPELAGSRAMLIYPTQIKTQAIQEEPFRIAYEYLQETLMHATLSIIIGFSFRDPAINDILQCALTKNRRLKLVVVEPKMNEDLGIAFSELLQKLGIEEGEWQRRMRIIKGKFGHGPFVIREIAETVRRLDQWDKLVPWVEMS